MRGICADGHCAVDYLLNGTSRRAGTATAILVIYFALMLSMAITYFRLLYIVHFDPGFVPLRRPAVIHGKGEKRHRRIGAGDDGLGGGEYEAPPKKVADWHSDADAPWLEEFYRRDVFECEMDGRPRWCTECRCWKPDRAHHCSDVGRCVRKMDHFCPWYVGWFLQLGYDVLYQCKDTDLRRVGGVVGENSFKFFIQFVFYSAIYSFFSLAVVANYLHEQIITPVSI
jgi:palmitoyltransferase